MQPPIPDSQAYAAATNLRSNMDMQAMLMAFAAQQSELEEEEKEQSVRAQNPGGIMIPQQYGNQQAAFTAARASYGDIPAMMATGASYAGAAFSGAATGFGNMLSAVGSQIMPVTYTPPARVVPGYYGQYAQETGWGRGLQSYFNLAPAPRSVETYKYGYHNVSALGERLGGAFTAAGTVATGLGAGAPLGAMAGKFLGAALGSPLGPLGMAAGGLVGSLAGGMLGYTGVDALAEVVSQRRQMNAYLESSSYRYIGAGSALADPRMGAGMSAGARRQATDYLRRMDISDPTMNMDDMFNILQGATESGLMVGISDMDDFKKKFKSVVSGVKQITRTLNTTLEEGLRFMKEFKSIGVDATEMADVTFQAAAFGKVAGRTAQEMVGIGMQGADLFRGTGVNMRIGYQQNVMNMSAIRAARDAGLISQEVISQAGGEEALAQRMTASSMQFMQSAMGRGFGAAFYNPGAGPAGFDMQAFQNAALSGGLSMQDLAQRAAGALGTPERVIGYQANQDKFLSEMGKSFGGKGLDIARMNAAMASARYLVQTGATSNMNDALRYTLIREQGLPPMEADALIATTKNAGGAFRANIEATNNTMLQRRIDEAMRVRGPGYMMDRLGDWFKGVVEPAVNLAEDVTEGVKETIIENWEEDIMGVHRYDLRGVRYERAGDYELDMGRTDPMLRRLFEEEERARETGADQGGVNLFGLEPGVEPKEGRPEEVAKTSMKMLRAIREGKITKDSSPAQIATVLMDKAMEEVTANDVRVIQQASDQLRQQSQVDKARANTAGQVRGLYKGEFRSERALIDEKEASVIKDVQGKFEIGDVWQGMDGANLQEGRMLTRDDNIVEWGMGITGAVGAAGVVFPLIAPVTTPLAGVIAGSTLLVKSAVDLTTDSAGGQLLTAARDLEGFGLGEKIIKTADTVAAGEYGLTAARDIATGKMKYKTMRQEDIMKGLKMSQGLAMTYEQAEQAADPEAEEKVQTAVAEGQISSDMNLNDIAKALFGVEGHKLTKGQIGALYKVANKRGMGAIYDAVKKAKEARYLLETQATAGLTRKLDTSEEVLKDMAEEVSEQAGLPKDLTKAQLSQLLEPRFIKGITIEERTKLFNQALNKYTSEHKIDTEGESFIQLRRNLAGISGLETDETGKIIGRTKATVMGDYMGAENVDLLRVAGQAVVDIRESKADLGRVALQTSFLEQMKDTKLTKDQQKAAMGAMTVFQEKGMEGLEGLKPEDVRALGTFAAGRYVLQAPKIQQKLMEMEKDLKDELSEIKDPHERAKRKRKEADEALEDLVSDDKMRKNVLDVYMTKTDAHDAGQSILSTLFDSLSSKTGAYIGTGGKPGETGEEGRAAEQGSAQQVAAVQMNINMMVLQALSALNNKLR